MKQWSSARREPIRMDTVKHESHPMPAVAHIVRQIGKHRMHRIGKSNESSRHPVADGVM